LIRSKSVRFSDGVVPGGTDQPISSIDPVSASAPTTSSNYTEIENSNPANNIRKKSSYLLSKKYKISNSK
jgi:hypothetical protein